MLLITLFAIASTTVSILTIATLMLSGRISHYEDVRAGLIIESADEPLFDVDPVVS